MALIEKTVIDKIEVVGPCQNSGIYCMVSTLGHFGGGRMTHFFPTVVWIHTLRHLSATFIDFGAKMEPRRIFGLRHSRPLKFTIY